MRYAVGNRDFAPKKNTTENNQTTANLDIERTHSGRYLHVNLALDYIIGACFICLFVDMDVIVLFYYFWQKQLLNCIFFLFLSWAGCGWWCFFLCYILLFAMPYYENHFTWHKLIIKLLSRSLSLTFSIFLSISDHRHPPPPSLSWYSCFLLPLSFPLSLIFSYALYMQREAKQKIYNSTESIEH